MDLKAKFDPKTKKYNFYNKKTQKRLNTKAPRYKFLSKLRIPPGYSNVVASSNPGDDLHAIGVDSKGRSQYIYNPEFTERNKELKFSELIHFGRKLRRIRGDITRNIENAGAERMLGKDAMISLALFLIDHCNFRVGSEKYKKLYDSYGVTTINAGHLKRLANSYKIEFIGKKGVRNVSLVKNAKVCSLLDRVYDENSGAEYLFTYFDPASQTPSRITETHINTYLKRYHKSISVKMFRTWSANHILLRELLKMSLPDDETQARKNINMAVSKASGQMHHTKNVSRKSYMNNEIIDLYLTNPQKFKRIILQFRKSNGDFPTTDRMLNLLLKYIKGS